MAVLITGASGFVGRALCARLAGTEIRALGRREVAGPWSRFVACDLGAGVVPADALEGVDTVFHLAGIAHALGGVPGGTYRRVNVEGTRSLIEAAAAAGVRGFVYFSSVKAAADPPEEKCVDEGWDAPPADPYGASKREAERVVLETGLRAGMRCVILRPALVYGPGVKGNLLRLMALISAGRCPPLPDTGNRRSMVHVEDLAQAAVLAAKTSEAAGRTYIVCDPRPYSTRELYVGLCRALERPVPRWSVPPWALRAAGRVGDIGERLLGRRLPVSSEAIGRLLDSACYRPDRIMRELGWRPRHDLPGSIPEMVAAWREAQGGRAA